MRRFLPLLVIVAVAMVALGGAAVASHDFGDVPDSSPFHEDISWMADAGIAPASPTAASTRRIR